MPPLAVAYADTGQDETELRAKIDDLLRGGTKYLWVVRLAGPPRVDVYEHGRPMRVALPGEELHAPGVLRNPVRVEALYDREAAMEATLRNVLQRAGYHSIDEVRAEGEARGEAKGLAEAARRLVASGMTVEQTAAMLKLDIAFVRAAIAQVAVRGAS